MAGDDAPLSSVMPNVSHSVVGPVGTGFFGQLQAQKDVGPLRPWKAGNGSFSRQREVQRPTPKVLRGVSEGA